MILAKLTAFSLVSIGLLSACPSKVQPVAIGSQNASLMARGFSQFSAQNDNSRFITEVASAFHEAWRAGRRKADGSYEPRMKETKDAAWIQAHNTNQVDIANTAYAALPGDWQAENRASAEIAVQEILKNTTQMLTPAFIEQASNVIHIKWLERNSWAKGGELDMPYAQLPEPEKQKDREALYQAIHQGIALNIVSPQQVATPVSQAIAQMLTKL
jgi:hypothetical protein